MARRLSAPEARANLDPLDRRGPLSRRLRETVAALAKLGDVHVNDAPGEPVWNAAMAADGFETKVLGFYAAMLAFLVYYIRFIGQHGWAVTLSIATVVPVVCFFFFFFDIAMRIVLPKGYSEPMFIPLYDIFL